MLRVVLVAGVLAGASVATRASAEPPPRVRAVVELPAGSVAPLVAPPVVPQISPYLYLNRCIGGCIVHGGASNDARTQHSSIPAPGDYTLAEFTNAVGVAGSEADADWAAVVKCVQEVYSPYAITVTDTEPQNASYTEAIVAGQPGDIGRPVDNLGVAPIAANCTAQDNVISFTFANHHPGLGLTRLLDICWTAAQESAHAFGLDHEYQFTDGTSTCRDPMTYRNDCGGQKFFRNSRAACGEDAVRACRCGGTQSSHASLLLVFGPGTPTTSAPTVTLEGVAGTAIPAGKVVVHATAAAQRGVAKVELYLNGSRWAVAAGAPFGATGQPASDYTLTIPTEVPDSVIDMMVRATDDLGVSTDSAIRTVTRVAACTAASDCLADQSCTEGKCAYPAPPGVLGASCPYAQYCQSWDCIDTDQGKRCASECQVDEPASCPASFSCADTGGGKGYCVEVASGGCCSVQGRGQPWSAVILSVMTIAGVMVQRRRRAGTSTRS